jgi:succinate dehydrogenase / fumarate reductase membrane anchor subunit
MSQATETRQVKAGPGVRVLRSQLGRARGLGAAKTGTAHWWAERVTSLALVPLSLWFVLFALGLSGRPRAAVAHAVAGPLTATLLLATVLITFHHMQLGLQVVIEDYARARTRTVLILAVKAVTVLLALACVVSVLKLAFSG